MDYNGPICDFCGYPSNRESFARKTEREDGETTEAIVVDICTSEECEDGQKVREVWAMLRQAGRALPVPAVGFSEPFPGLQAPAPRPGTLMGATAPPKAITPVPPTPATTTVQQVKQVKAANQEGFTDPAKMKGVKPRSPDAGEDLWEYLYNVRVEHNLKVRDFCDVWCPIGTNVYYQIPQGKPVSPYYVEILARWSGLPESTIRAMEEMSMAKKGKTRTWADPSKAPVVTIEKREEEPAKPPAIPSNWGENLTYVCLQPVDGKPCGGEFKKREQARRHVQAAHDYPPYMGWVKWEVKGVPEGKTLYRCPKCDCPHSRKRDLAQHQTDGTCPYDALEGVPAQGMHPGDREAGINSKAIKGDGQLVGVNAR